MVPLSSHLLDLLPSSPFLNGHWCNMNLFERKNSTVPRIYVPKEPACSGKYFDYLPFRYRQVSL